MTHGHLAEQVKTRDVPIIGELAHVQNVLRSYHGRGELVSRSRPVRLPGGRVFVTAHLVDRPSLWRRCRVPIAVAVGVVGVLAAVAWLVVATVTAAARWVESHLPEVLGAGLLALLVVAAFAHLGCEVIVTVTHRRRWF